jgi:hypothetical protein
MLRISTRVLAAWAALGVTGVIGAAGCSSSTPGSNSGVPGDGGSHDGPDGRASVQDAADGSRGDARTKDAPEESPSAVDGACGSANGKDATRAPSGSLCTSGDATPVSGSGPWDWSCKGIGGGKTSACSAPLLSAFYVATTGKDSNPGTITAPFLTLGKAQSAMQTSASIKNAVLGPGTYDLSANWTWAAADDGETWLAQDGPGTAIVAGNMTYFVSSSGANQLSIYGLVFDSVWDNTSFGPGLYFTSGSNIVFRWNTISGCKYECLGGSGLSNSVFDSNTIDGQTTVPKSNPDLWYSAIDFRGWGGTFNAVTISHNKLSQIQGTGIDLEHGPSNPPMTNNVIDNNLLEDVALTCNDCGSLYLYTPSLSSTGNQITNNVTLGVGPPADANKCIYLDDGSSYVTLTGNVCGPSAKNGVAEYGLFIHGGNDNTARHNVFVVGVTSSSYTDFFGNTWDDEFLVGYQSNAGGFGGTGNVFDQNIAAATGAFPKPLWWINGVIAAPSVSSNDYYSSTGAMVIQYGATDSAPFVNVDPDFGSAYQVGTGSEVVKDLAWPALSTTQGPLPYAGP